MALKDWKKNEWNKNLITFEKNGNIIKVEKAENEGSILAGKKDWILKIPMEPVDKYVFFKTKSQALAYAKSYMRKN
jgi:hypothetical protein